ncbi:hypothetical protein PSTT_05157 [Puccinia striiformis]|uniref:Uncharacterized protein n=1 Tax=Puccinia striiformis TaxID=27350 RepID=A0A2S4VPW9_9BASI|nr:hypothetical protein PSTT_05157 [Puccinia striiformis]
MSSDPTNPTNPSASADSTTKQPTVPISDMTTEDMLRAVLQVQHASTLQTASRMERLEDALLELSLKPEPVDRPLALAPGRIDLQRFKTSDGPMYNGPFQSVEPFITWVNGVQIFFATKAVSHPEDKIRVVGCLIREPNTLTFYANDVENLVTKTWIEFKKALFDFALPPGALRFALRSAT